MASGQGKGRGSVMSLCSVVQCSFDDSQTIRSHVAVAVALMADSMGHEECPESAHEYPRIAGNRV